MKSSEVVRNAMAESGISQLKLAEKLGYKYQSTISNALSRENGMRVDLFIKMMNALGYDVIARRKDEEMVIKG